MSRVLILPSTSDERLLELVRGEEERAFEMVVARYRASLVGYCMRLGLSESRAEDAVQQCFLSALLALRRGDSVRDLRAWLGRIAHNVAVNMMRAGSANRESGLGAEWGIEDRAIHIPDFDGGIAAREALAEVAALPPMQREALLQSALGGRSYGEVAASMGVSEGAVRGLLHRARLSLRNAAAVFSPLPVMRRVSGWLGGGGHSAGRVLELTAPGASTGLSSTAVRAIGAGLTAIVLAAGAAVAPLHGSSHARPGALAQADRPTLPSASVVPAVDAGSTAAPAKFATRVASATSSGSSARGFIPATHGMQPERLVQGPSSTPSHRREAGSSSPGSESQVLTLSSTSAPPQASAAASGTVTQPTAPPPEAPSTEVKQPNSEEPGSDDGSEKEHGDKELSEQERAEHTREREAEEAAERAELESGKTAKDS